MIKFISAPSFRILLVLGLLVFLMGLMVSKTTQTLDEFDKVTGEVIESGVTTITNSKGNTSNVYAVKLNTLDLSFGIKEYDGDLFEYFVANDPKGKELTIYYDPIGKLVADNLTLHVGQVQLGQNTLLTFEDSKAIYYFGEIVFIGLLIIFIPIYIWVLRIERRKTKEGGEKINYRQQNA